MNIILIYFAIKYDGDWNKIYEALEKKENVTLREIKDLEEKIEKEDWKYLTILDTLYPNKLKETYKPPFVIWYKGNVENFENRFLCPTGNQVDEITIKRINEFIPEMEKRFTLVLPGFKGVDQKIDSVSKFGRLYILASGFEKNYLEKDFKFSDQDLVISEYPPTAVMSKEKLRSRNRIIASFADCLILFSSEKDGPMNHMVSSFLNMGKDIYCFPGDASDTDGNSELIKQGAQLITKIKDLSH